MLPRVGEEAEIEIKIIARTRQEFQSAAYAELGLPRAPAIMINDEMIAAGQDIEEHRLLQEIPNRRQSATFPNGTDNLRDTMNITNKPGEEQYGMALRDLVQ
jgi:hypothetical protein